MAGLRRAAGALDCGNSGTTMRLLAGLLAAQPFESRLVGDDSLSRRPMDRVVEPLILFQPRGATVNGCAHAVVDADGEQGAVAREVRRDDQAGDDSRT